MKIFELIIQHYMLMAEMDAAFADFNEYMAEVADELDALQDQCSELRYEVWALRQAVQQTTSQQLDTN